MRFPSIFRDIKKSFIHPLETELPLFAFEASMARIWHNPSRTLRCNLVTVVTKVLQGALLIIS